MNFRTPLPSMRKEFWKRCDVDLNIRDFDEGLMKLLKARAVEGGVTLKECVTKILEEATDEDGRDGVHLRGSVEGGAVGRGGKGTGEPGKAVRRAHEQAGSQGEPGAVAGSVQKDRGVEGKGKTCKYHGKPMKDFGNSWVCEGPPVHKELK